MRYIFIFLLCCYNLSLAQPLSKNAKVSLVVVSPGDEIYSYFGHCALWIYDAENQIDKTYEYNTADVSDWQFYSQTLLGTLDYQLWIRSMPYLKETAQKANRKLTILPLNLTHAQTQKLYYFLMVNWLPQNRKFRYRFFEQNCATRIRDIIERVCQIQLDTTWHTTPQTYRQWMNQCLPKNSWSKFFLNFSLGFSVDKLATTQEALFLPKNLEKAVKNTILQSGNFFVVLP